MTVEYVAMNREGLIERFFELLIAGDRAGSRDFIRTLISAGTTVESLITDLFWPTHELLERLYKADQLSCLSHHLSTRLLRVLIDQTAVGLRRQPSQDRTILAFCGTSEGEELGAQMATDLIEAAGFTISFAGGGVPNDEILARVQEHKPNVLLMFCSAAADLPSIRQLVDTLHEIGACPHLQIAVGGGVFNRAEGLAEEIGADVWAKSPLEMVEVLIEHADERSNLTHRTVGRNRKKQSKAA